MSPHTQNTNSDLCIIGYGMQSPTGLNASMSIANVIAGISRISLVKDFEDSNYKPIAVGIAEYLEDNHNSEARMMALFEPAFEESISVFNNIPVKQKTIRVLFCLPQMRLGLNESILTDLVTHSEELEFQLGISVKHEFIREDHDSGIIAIKKARELLNKQESDFVVIAGIDSFLSNQTINWLENVKHLKCSSNRNGYSPGEAAACLLLCHQRTALESSLPIKAFIKAEATQFEIAIPGSNLPTKGSGLINALQDVLVTLPEDEFIDDTFCTLKGLRHEAEEFAYSCIKHGSVFKKPGEFKSLASFWGDIGAASAPSLICYALEQNELGFSSGPNNLIFTISPGTSRSAALIRTEMKT